LAKQMVSQTTMEDLKDAISRLLKEPSKVKPLATNRIPSAVVIPFCEREDGYHILLLKKVDSNYPHGGQVCLPGGCHEERDGSLLTTALREFEEETGIPSRHVEIAGALEPVETRSTNFIIYPFVGFLPYPESVKIDGVEIEKAFFVPLHFVLKNHPFPTEAYPYRGITFHTPIIRYQGETIWGATARILDRLMEVIKRAWTGR